jgi:enterochelin esterase-like enzyme
MHDGQMLFDSSTTWNRHDWEVDETLGRLMSEKKVKPCIVVGIWNTPKRHMEYFPQKALNYLSENQIDSLMNANRGEGTPKLFDGGIVADNYLKFLVTELKPFIDKTYATHTDSGNTYIMGSSMGGLISMYAICEYPEVFGGAACLSTHWPGVFTVENNPVPGALLSYLREHLPPPGKHLLYFDFGTETLDNLYEPFQNHADQILKEKGYGENDWITRKFVGADHSEKAWSQRLHIPVMFLLGLD